MIEPLLSMNRGAYSVCHDVVFRARKCRKSVSHGDDVLDPTDPAHDPLSPQVSGLAAASGAAGRGVASGRAANGTRSISLSGHGAHGVHGAHGLRPDAVRMSAMNSGSTSGSPSYHRSHITGASSSSASGESGLSVEAGQRRRV